MLELSDMEPDSDGDIEDEAEFDAVCDDDCEAELD